MSTAPVRSNNSSKARVLVVGDAMLDRYWYGAVDRISPEAPVPVVQGHARGRAHRRRRQRGLQRRSRWARRPASWAWSATTSPATGWKRCCARPASPPTSSATPACRTTVKLRVIGRQQQLLRMDFENEPDHEALALAERNLRRSWRRSTTRCCSPTTARAAWRTSAP